MPIVDGSYSKPDANSPLFSHWQRCNDMVLSWILNSLDKNIRDSVMFCETAAELWKDLNERYGQSNKARLFQAQKDVSCISQGDMDIACYFNKAKKVWDEFNAVGATPRCTCKKCDCEVNIRLHNHDQEQKLIQFLMGLNESYTVVRGNILMMTPLPTLGQTYSLLVQEERQRQVKQGSEYHIEAASFSVGVNQNMTNNTARNLPSKRPENRRSQLFCDHCRRSGHTVDKCYKIHGYPNKQGGKSKVYRSANNAWGEQETQLENSPTTTLPGLSSEQSKQLLQFLTILTAGAGQRSNIPETTASAVTMAGMVHALNAIHSLCALSQETWILDSGAT